jgi:hypothetical protein
MDLDDTVVEEPVDHSIDESIKSETVSIALSRNCLENLLKGNDEDRTKFIKTFNILLSVDNFKYESSV